MALPTPLERRRFELFYGSLVICGLAMVAGQLPRLLEASGPTDVSPIAALLSIGGLGLAVTSGREALLRDRETWEAEFEERSPVVAIVIGSGALLVGAGAYWVLAAGI
ncbi:hypothetical protein GCM10028857_26030 [Salinarchaeum chitinilyticum]